MVIKNTKITKVEIDDRNRKLTNLLLISVSDTSRGSRI